MLRGFFIILNISLRKKMERQLDNLEKFSMQIMNCCEKTIKSEESAIRNKEKNSLEVVSLLACKCVFERNICDKNFN